MQMDTIRGATTINVHTEFNIKEATTELIQAIMSANSLTEPDLLSVVFTATPDITAAFPSSTIRDLLPNTALLDLQQMVVPGALDHCIRVLVTTKVEAPRRFVYLRGASVLRAVQGLNNVI